MTASLKQSYAVTGTIYRLGSPDTFGCNHCKLKGDRYFMEAHPCKGMRKEAKWSNVATKVLKQIFF